MSKRRGLGKGLQALIPVAEEVPRGQEGMLEIDIDAIKPAQRQARQLFDQDKLDGLADSIKEHGVIQPVLVRKLADGGYELIAGERRWRACKSLGLKTIAAFVKDCPDLEAAAASLIENIQREDLNPLEEASAYRQLMEEFALTQEEVSGRVGKSRPLVANTLRLLGLPAEIKELIYAGKISAGHARALLVINDARQQIAVAEKIAEQQLSVRQAEKIAREALEGKKASVSRQAPAQDLLKAEERLKKFLNTRVKVKESRGGGGKLEIGFSNQDDLKRILGLVIRGRKE
ncbi:ParB/RepB/Spo0J family partition protein [Pelotomaculum propionicicum]|uniref:ParB/RepB/Spo0J family partition protein n=1 Tax=Pelotomaculum propionicicum TaxID=258475 RepID=UPI003B787355